MHELVVDRRHPFILSYSSRVKFTGMSRVPRRRVRRGDDDGDNDDTTGHANNSADAPSVVAELSLPTPMGVRAWMTIEGPEISGTITFLLDAIRCPSAVTNFRFLCESHEQSEEHRRRQQVLGADKPLPPPLKGTAVTAVRSNEMLEFGTSATQSYWGGFFKDEGLAEAGRSAFTNANIGTLSMVNAGPNTNASRFFVTLGTQLGDLDKYHVPFGRVVDGMNVLEALNRVKTDPKRNCAPRDRHVIVACGVVDPLAAFKTGNASAPARTTQADALGSRRGRDADDVLSGRFDVARVRVGQNDDGTVADDRIHSTMAMSNSLKRRRGEVHLVDPRFAGTLATSVIDSSVPLGEAFKPSRREAEAAQQRLFESDLQHIEDKQRYKKGAQKLKKLKEQRVARAVDRRSKTKRPEKTKYY
jgi:cyclophilin family peptidyl-prolyl cis-trans isomerase